MKTPRDISGKNLVKHLKVFGYETVRQNGSHIMLTTNQKGQHHLVIPNHSPLKIGTLNSITARISQHFNLGKDEVIRKLFS